jgi:hypothetical protein
MNIPIYDEHYLNVLSSVYYDNIRQIERLYQTNHEIRDILLRAHANNRNRTNNRNRPNNRNRQNRPNNSNYTQYMNNIDNRNYYRAPNNNYAYEHANMNDNMNTPLPSASQPLSDRIEGRIHHLPRRFYFDASYNLQRAPRPTRNNTFDTLLNAFLEPVPTYPGTLQIEIATRNMIYRDIVSPMNTSCPISLERFTDNDIVTIICYCGHIFMATEIHNWFSSNCRCPVCRYDIREYRATDIINHANDISNNTPIPTIGDNHAPANHDFSGNLIDSITDTLLNELLYSVTDPSRNLVENTLATFYFAFPSRER